MAIISPMKPASVKRVPITNPEVNLKKKDQKSVTLKLGGKNVTLNLEKARAILLEATPTVAPFTFVSPTEHRTIELYGELEPGEVAEKEYTRNPKGENHTISTFHCRECKAVVMTENRPSQPESIETRENMLGHSLLQAPYLRDAIATMRHDYNEIPKYLFLTSLPQVFIENKKTPNKSALVSLGEFLKIAHPEISQKNSLTIINELVEYLTIVVKPNGYVKVVIDKNRIDPYPVFGAEKVEQDLEEIQKKLEVFNQMGADHIEDIKS